MFSKNNKGRLTVGHAIKKGAQTLDCYAGKLPKYYKQFGFREYKRIPWEDKYAPPNWDYKKFGKPDIIFMELRKKK